MKRKLALGRVMKQSGPTIEPIAADAFMASVIRDFTADAQLAELALSRASADPVRTMAMHIDDDSKRALLDVARVATRKNLQVAEHFDANQSWLLERMGQMTGADFDYAYIDRISIHHRLEVKLLKRGQTITNPEISALASRLLAVVEARAKLSRQLSGNLDSLGAGEAREPRAHLLEADHELGGMGTPIDRNHE
jgi:predicted outer membrane protein